VIIEDALIVVRVDDIIVDMEGDDDGFKGRSII
jgi:hypothetical protein